MGKLMTLTEFIDKLSRTRCQWMLSGGCIRTYLDDRAMSCCPITYLAGKKFQTTQYTTAGKVLGLSMKTIQAIIRAADNDILRAADNDIRTPALRRKLLNACRLTTHD